MSKLSQIPCDECIHSMVCQHRSDMCKVISAIDNAHIKINPDGETVGIRNIEDIPFIKEISVECVFREKKKPVFR